MRYDKVRLSQYKEFGEDWIAIGFKFGIGFFAAAAIFAVVGTLIVNAWFAYNDRNVWYSYSGRVLPEVAHPIEQAGPQAVPPAEHDDLIPAKPAPEAGSAAAEMKPDASAGREPPSRERPPPR
jgi:hypothetical protein